MTIIRPPGDRARASQGAGQRPQHVAHLDLGAEPRPVRLGGDDEVVSRRRAALGRDYVVQGKGPILAVEHQDRRLDIERVAGFLAGLGLPPFGQDRPEAAHLLVELVRRAALQRDVPALHRQLGLRSVDAQQGRFGIVEIGDDDDELRMLLKPVRQFFQGQAHILHTDLLADDAEGYGGKLPVQVAQHPGQHRAVADAGIEQVERRRRRLQERNFAADPLRHFPLLRAGRDEHQVFFAVVEEAEGVFRALRSRVGFDRNR